MSTIVTDLISHLQAGEAISAQDAVYIDETDGKVYKFDVVSDTQPFAGIAKESGVLNEYIRVVQSGRVKGFAGLTPGAFVYASTTTPGGFQLLEPASSQKIILGIAKSASELTINAGLGIKPGGDGGGGGLDVYYTENMDGFADTSSFSTGNNAAFLAGGTLQGSLALDSVSPLSGTNSLTYTQAAGSLNDWFASELIDIELKQQNNWSGMTFYFTYDGNDNDGKFVVYDVTNGAEITSGVELVETQSGATRYALSFFVPSTCTQIRWGYQVLVENSGAVLELDDVEITSNPFVFKDLITPRTVVRGAGNAGESITAETTDIPFTEVEDELGLWDGDSFTVPADGDYSFTGHILLTTSAARAIDIYVNGVKELRAGTTVDNDNHHFSIVSRLNSGDVVSLRADGNGGTLNNNDTSHFIHIQRIPEATQHVVTPASSSETTTKILSATTPTVGDLGDLTFTGLVIGHKYLLTGVMHQESISSVENKVQFRSGSGGGGSLYGAVSHFETSGSASNSRLNIAIEFEAVSSDLYANKSGSVNTYGGTAADGSFLQLTNITRQFLAAIPTPLTAYIKDVKASGTMGGTFTSGAWQTRDLNVVEGDSEIVSLSGNQFTLQAGKYEIEASAPAYKVNYHKIKLRNITDLTDEIIGSNARVASTGDSMTESHLKSPVTITSSKVFEIQHQCQTTQASNGVGLPVSFGVDEIYTQVVIRRIG